MRVVALCAIHLLLQHRVMLRQVELGLDVGMTPKTGGRFFAGINDELPAPAADLDVTAPRSVARLHPVCPPLSPPAQ